MDKPKSGHRAWIGVYYAASFFFAYVVFKFEPIPAISSPTVSLLNGSTDFLLLFVILAIVSSILTLYLKSFLPLYCLSFVAIAQYAALYPNFFHANVLFNEGSGTAQVLWTGHLSSSSNFLDTADLVIPGAVFFLSEFSMVLGLTNLQSIPFSNLVFVATWYFVVPLSVQTRLKNYDTDWKYVIYVAFWGLMFNYYVLYEQGLIDHQYAIVLFSLLLVSTSIKQPAATYVSFILFAAIVVTHSLFAVISLATLVIMLFPFSKMAADSKLVIACALIFSGWTLFNVIGLEIAREGIQSLISLFAIQFSSTYIAHAALNTPPNGLIGTIVSDAMKATIVTVMILYLWGFGGSFYDIIKGRRSSLGVSVAAGMATLLLLLLFWGSSNYLAYGFADRWLWIAPLAFPVALLDTRIHFRYLTRYAPLVKPVVVVAVSLIVLSNLFTGISLYWHPVLQDQTEASFLGTYAGSTSLSIAPSSTVQYYLFVNYKIDTINGPTSAVIILVSSYTQFITPASNHSRQVMPLVSQLIYSDGSSLAYESPNHQMLVPT